MGAQKGLDVLLSIFCHLLKFVNHDDAPLSSLFDVLEYLSKCVLWHRDVAQSDVERGGVLHRVVAEAGTERAQSGSEKLHQACVALSHGIEYRAPEDLDKLLERRSVEYVERTLSRTLLLMQTRH